MGVVTKIGRPQAAPALFRLLADSSLSRAALYTCGFPVVLLDAVAPGRPVTYANAAFEGFFGFRTADAVGRSLGKLIFKADEATMQALFAEPASRWEMKAWDKGGALKHVEIALSALRSAEGAITHWVLAFSDRSDIERLRSELEALRKRIPAA
jgi:PAS domain S-box-containing protein